MWLPLSNRKRRNGTCCSTVSATVSTQAPAALTSTRAVTTSRTPRELRIRRHISPRSARSGTDDRPALGGVDRADYDKPRIVGKAIRIFVAVMEAALERQAGFT